MRRRAEFRPFSWLHDLWKRDQIDLSPPYQRRSVWPDRFKLDFVTTVMLSYPCPAIFLYEEIRADGSFIYKVVDGKQRLTTLFDFVSDKIPISDDFPNMGLRGKRFSELDDRQKLTVWRYEFAVEFVEQENETIINDIFNRINKNVAKLSHQELRHALFSGEFAKAADDLSDEMEIKLPSNFPNIGAQSRRQMKDVENSALMLLFIELGERSMSQGDLDEAFAKRDEVWDQKLEVVSVARAAVEYIGQIVASDASKEIASSRLKNQTDFYSLYGAVVELSRTNQLPERDVAIARLRDWLSTLREPEQPEEAASEAARYLAAARSASNDAGPRRIRIDIVKHILLG